VTSVDRLVRHTEIRRDLCDRLARLNWVKHLATELDRVPPRHDDLLIINAQDSSIPTAGSPGHTKPPPESRLPADHRWRDQILRLHHDAVAAGESGYLDPESGLFDNPRTTVSTTSGNRHSNDVS
jgi:hypothetical protein